MKSNSYGFNLSFVRFHRFFGKTNFSVYLVYFSIFYGLFCWGKVFGKVEKSFNFEWSGTAEAFLLDGNAFPTLHLFEHCYYLFHASGEVLSITEQNDSVYGGSDLFQNSIRGVGEYILFNPDESTPRLLKYQNLQNSSNYGEIVIQSFEEKAFLKLPDSEAGGKFGSEITITQDLSIFSSATGYNNNEGLIVKFNQDSEGNYSFEKTISSPITGPVFWGSSLSVDQNSSFLLIGIANANNYQGALYKYPLPGSGLTKVSEGIGAGSMYGWTTLAEFGKIFSGSLSVLDSEGGYVSVSESSSPSLNLQTLRAPLGQFGNEFGYAIACFENFLLVGSPGEDDLIREDAGSVYVYKLEDEFAYKHKIIPSTPNEGDRFGHTLSINQDFIFVGAPNGDGLSPNTGVVYVYEYNASENLVVKEVFKILPPDQDSGMKFGQNLLVQGDFVFISSLRSNDKGTVYVYKKSINNTSWKHVRTLPLGDFSNHLSFPENISLASNMGVLAIGLENESSINLDAGAVQVLYNPAWGSSSIPALPPYFENNDILVVNATEDQSFPVVIDFNASNHSMYPNPVFWEVNSTDSRISTENYEINSTTGIFSYHIPEDLFGEFTFEVSVSNELQKFSHFFVIDTEQVQDQPNFVDFNLTTEPIYLPHAAENDEYNYTFNVFDADDDNLFISILEGQLPDSLEIQGLSIVGSPLSEGNFSFRVELSDGSAEIDQSFVLEVVSGNSAPEGFYQGSTILNDHTLELEFNENFSLSNWNETISALEIIDNDSELISIEITDYPQNGYLLVSEKFTTFDENHIRYTPRFNYNGTDNFSLRFQDNHPAVPKHFDLKFNLSIKSINSAPFVTSPDPVSTVLEGHFFEHIFEIFDAEEDFYTVSFQNLPDWLSFDGVRRIFGKPTNHDYSEQITPFFISVTDQEGNTYSEKLSIGVIPENYPPLISYLDENISEISFELEEDGSAVEFTLNSMDPDGVNNLLIWSISEHAQYGETSLINSNSTFATFSHKPDGNFSGIDFVEITVTESADLSASDQITVIFTVSPEEDAPRFESRPFPGLVVNKPWIYEIRGIDADPSDNLTLQSLLNYPSWLKLIQTDQRTWTFRGQPSVVGEEVDISLRLSDHSTSVDQNFTLKVLDSVEDLFFLQTDEITFTETELSPELKIAQINMDEDSNWSASQLSVNGNDEIRVHWTVLQQPLNGVFSYSDESNGKITDLVYMPNPNFFGFDKVVLEASDNYSITTAEIEFHVLSVEDPLLFDEFPENLVENENEKFDFIISYQDGDGLDSLNDFEITGLPLWLNLETVSHSSFSKTLRVYGEPTVEDIGTYNISASISEINGQEIIENFTVKVNFFNKPPIPVPASIKSSFVEDEYSVNSPKKWINFFSASDEETSVEQLTWSIVTDPPNGFARINESGTELVYYPDANYSGYDFFNVGVMDRGGLNNSLPRQTVIPVSVNIQQVNDLPVFQTVPPSMSDGIYSTTWNDEKDYYYEVSVLDSDWPWQGQPSLSLKSSLPTWASWKNLGNGGAIISGSPQWFHQGNYSFSIVAKSGNDEIVQNFELEILVDDYPPRVQNSNDQTIYNKIQIFVLEDGSLEDVENTVLGLKAFNPDKVAGETLRWLPYNSPTSGGSISLSSYLDSDGHFARISDFQYEIPSNFNGIDRFSIIVDEGDRQAEVPFEINIKAIPDPPIFSEGSVLTIEVSKNSYFERLITASDPDFQSVDFKLLYPSNSAKWLIIKSEKNDASGPSVKIGGIVPSDFTNDSFTMIATDPTGRFSLLEINIYATN